MTKLNALTIWQPWATLIMTMAKPYEFRSWPAPARAIGRPLGIHAGARPVRLAEVRNLLRTIEIDAATRHRSGTLVPEIAAPILERILRREIELPLSHMLGTATLASVATPAEIAAIFGAASNDSDREQHFNYGWRLTDPTPREPPIPARGAQGLWQWSGA